MDIIYLARQRNWGASELQRAASKSLFDDLLQKGLNHLLNEARKAGYKRLTIGPHPAWHMSNTNIVVAEPNVLSDGPHGKSWLHPPLWAGMLEPLGGMSCGNGLNPFDGIQAQFRLGTEDIRPIIGVYEL